MAWQEQPPITGSHSGCLNCGPHPDVFPPDGVIAVGFGMAALTKDGHHVWSESPEHDFIECMTGEFAEWLASYDPDHDWRIVLVAPLSERTYQRHRDGQWYLIEKGRGFA